MEVDIDSRVSVRGALGTVRQIATTGHMLVVYDDGHRAWVGPDIVFRANGRRKS